MGACAREAVDRAEKASNQSIRLPDAVNAMPAAADPAANIWRLVSPTSSAAQAYAIHAGRRGFNEHWQSRLIYAAVPIERRLPSMMPHRVTCRPTGGQMSMPRAGPSAATHLSSPTRSACYRDTAPWPRGLVIALGDRRSEYEMISRRPTIPSASLQRHRQPLPLSHAVTRRRHAVDTPLTVDMQLTCS